MISTQLMSFDFETDDFEKDIENALALPHFSFLLRSSPGRKLYLLDAILKIGNKEIDIVPKPIGSSTGTILIPLGHSPEPKFKVYFRIYAVEAVPKLRAFIIDDTSKKIVRATAGGTKIKSLKKKELWQGKI